MAEKIIITLDLESGDAAEFKRALQNIVSTQGTKAGNELAGNFRKSLLGGLSGIRNEILSLTAGYFAFNTVKTAFRDSARAAAQFETAVAEINSILPNNVRLTKEQEKSLISLSKQFGSSAVNQAKSFYQVISAGTTDAAEAQKLLTAANKLAIGGVADIGGSIDVLTSIVNAYGKENITAKEASDSLFTAVRIGKTTVDELSASLALAVPSARAAGVNLDMLNASVALLTANGFATSEAVTRVNALLTAFARNGDKLGNQMNISAVATDGLNVVLQRLIERTGGSSEKLLELLGRQEAVQAAQTLAKNNTKDLSDTYDQFTRKLNAADDAFNLLKQTSEFRYNQLIADIEALAIAFGQKLLPPLLSVTGTFRTFFGLTRGEGGALTDINAKISETRKELNKLIDVQAQFKEGVSVFGLNIIGPDEGKIAQQQEAIDKTRQKLNELLAKRTELLNQTKTEPIAVIPAPTPTVAAETDEKVLNSLDIFVAATQSKFEALTKLFGTTGKQVKFIGKEIASVAFNVIAAGVGNAFQKVGQALAAGQNAFEAFGTAIKGILADVASAIGDTFIKWGIANVVSGNVGMGSAQIAAGGALKVLAGFLGSQASTATASPTSGGVEPTSNLMDDTSVNDFMEQERVQPSTNVEVVVQGSLVQQEELGEFITRTLNESFAKQGVTLTDARVLA